MAFSVYKDANLTKQLKTLLKGGTKAAQAAEHAQTIIKQLIDGGVCDPKLIGRLTRYGEARIRDCIKYDLVGSYRLVGIMHDEGIVFLYVGSHSECDRWIRNNAGLEPILGKKRNSVIEVNPVDEQDTQPEVEANEEEHDADYDELLLKDITDQDLRKIFSGLCRKPTFGK